MSRHHRRFRAFLLPNDVRNSGNTSCGPDGGEASTAKGLGDRASRLYAQSERLPRRPGDNMSELSTELRSLIESGPLAHLTTTWRPMRSSPPPGGRDT